MATYREPNRMTHPLERDKSLHSQVRLNPHNISELMCDACKSSHIVETTQGFVCGSCGLVLEGQKIVFNRVNFADMERYASMGKTHIGTVMERHAHAHSVKLHHLQRLHAIESNEKELRIRAKMEIQRIFSHLNLSKTLMEAVYKKFLAIRNALNPGTKYRVPEKLVPLCIYFVCKVRSFSLNEAELLEVSKISKKEFNAFKLQVQYFLPQYKERDRQSYVLQRVMEVAEHFQLGMDFFFQAKHIVLHLWNSIKNTKDDVIAGLAASIVVLCGIPGKSKEDVNVHLICKRLNIKMSTIQSQVQRRIFESFKVQGFTTLLKSTDLLKQVMVKLGLIVHKDEKLKEGTEQETKENEEKLEYIPEKKDPDVIEIKLGGACPTCNHLKNIGYYFFAFEEQERYPVLLALKSYDMSNFCTDVVIKGRMSKIKSDSSKKVPLCEVEMIK